MGDESRVSIKCTKDPVNPHFSRTKANHLKFTVSKTFSASNVTIAMSSVGWVLACSGIARTFLMFEEAEQPLSNPACAGCIMAGRIVAKHEAIIFVKQFRVNVELRNGTVGAWLHWVFTLLGY